MQIKEELKKMDEFDIQSHSKGRWFDLVIANTLAIVFVALGLNAPLLSFTLAFIVMAYVQIGVYGYALNLYRRLNPSYETIFVPFKRLLKILCLKIVVMAGMALWGLLLIVPGIIFGLNSALSGFVLYENPDISIKDAIARSKTLVFGKRVELLLFMLALLSIVCLASSVGVGIYFLLSLAFKVPVWLIVLLIVLPAMIVTIVVVLPLFELYLAGLYDNAIANVDVLAQKNKTPAKTRAKKVSKS